MNRLKDKVAIVTGSTTGIGLRMAKIFAAEGAKVVVCGRRKGRGQAVVDEITAEGGTAYFCRMDITVPETIQELMDGAYEHYGRIDVLVNCAANVALKDGTVEELTIDMWDAILQSDLRGTFLATKAVLPYMLKNEKGGSIINIGSMASIGGDLGSTAYACAKSGVDTLTRYVAMQYGKQNIRCNCVRPGLIVTPENAAPTPDTVRQVFMNSILGNRYGCPEDIGYLCVYLASDESEYMSGQVLNMDGGLNSHLPTTAQMRELNSRTW